MNEQVRGHVEVPPGNTHEHLLTLGLRSIDHAWTWYQETFAEINTLAALRHLMTVDEFVQVMQDPRIEKHLVRGGEGQIEGLGVCTSDLTAWPLISPEFFERRWPDHYAGRRIWFVGFIGVRAGAHWATFRTILRAMQKGQPDDLWVMDVCAVNEQPIKLAARYHLREINPKGIAIEEIDHQTFLAMRFDGGRP